MSTKVCRHIAETGSFDLLKEEEAAKNQEAVWIGLGKNQILIFGIFCSKKSENQRKIRIKIN